MKRREKLNIKINMLKDSKEYIEQTHSKYICFRLEYNTRYGSTQKGKCFELIEFISESLYPYSTLEHWYRGNHKYLFNRMDGKDFVEARCQWIDWMISQLEQGKDLK